MKTHHMFIMLQLIFLFSLLMSGNGADVGVNEISRNIDAVGEESLSDPVTLHEVMMHCFEENMIERTSPRDISSVVYVNDIEDPVVTVDNWIDEIDAYNILLLASCVKHLTPEKHEYRPFDLDGYGGGNNVTYLNEIVQSVYPEVLDQILDVAASITDQVKLFIWGKRNDNKCKSQLSLGWLETTSISSRYQMSRASGVRPRRRT